MRKMLLALLVLSVMVAPFASNRPVFAQDSTQYESRDGISLAYPADWYLMDTFLAIVITNNEELSQSIDLLGSDGDDPLSDLPPDTVVVMILKAAFLGLIAENGGGDVTSPEAYVMALFEDDETTEVGDIVTETRDDLQIVRTDVNSMEGNGEVAVFFVSDTQPGAVVFGMAASAEDYAAHQEAVNDIINSVEITLPEPPDLSDLPALEETATPASGAFVVGVPASWATSENTEGDIEIATNEEVLGFSLDNQNLSELQFSDEEIAITVSISQIGGDDFILDEDMLASPEQYVATIALFLVIFGGLEDEGLMTSMSLGVPNTFTFDDHDGAALNMTVGEANIYLVTIAYPEQSTMVLVWAISGANTADVWSYAYAIAQSVELAAPAGE